MSIGVLDILGSLTPRFTEPIQSTDKEIIDSIYACYLRDFFDQPFQIDHKNIKVKKEFYSNHIADGLPDFYSHYHEKFVHLLTREISGRTKVMSKKRMFKENRANRIHWIKPILQNCSDPRITHFHFSEDDGSVRQYFWYKAKNYIIILEEVKPDYFLITSFCVDIRNISYYEAKYQGRCGP
ncbi:MAG: hypothetical protein NTX61_17985 [Bacteroidetes bacterium]|nr:hypothetical protein [Bacteroidota bacterium]